MSDELKTNIAGFLRLCVRYADDSISRKYSRIKDVSNIENQNTINQWKTYRDFTEHAIKEIGDGALDSWFEHLEVGDEWRPIPEDATGDTCGDTSNMCKIISLPVAELGFEERRKILDGIISPRPLVLASTRSNDGVENLAGLSSLAIISNSPPLIALSFSQDHDGRKRDSFVNLEKTRRIILHILPASLEMAAIVETASKSIPPNESEWDYLEVDEIASPSGEVWPAFFPLALAAIECELIQIHDLPEGAVASLCILGVRNILAPVSTIEALKFGATLSSLCQHGSYRLTSSPNGWGYDCKF